MKISKRYSHFVYGVIQSGLTCAIAAAIASIPFLSDGSFFHHWLASWIISWLTMLPIVLLAAPFIHRAVERITR